MAINQTDKQLNLVDNLVKQAVKLDDVYDEVVSLMAQLVQAGTVTDEIFEDTALKHIVAADVSTLVSRFTDLVTWINEPNQFRRDILRKVRP